VQGDGCKLTSSHEVLSLLQWSFRLLSFFLPLLTESILVPHFPLCALSLLLICVQRALSASRLLAPYCIPLFLEKLTSSYKVAKIDSLEGLEQAAGRTAPTCWPPLRLRSGKP